MATSPAPDAAATPGMCPGLAVKGGSGAGGGSNGGGGGDGDAANGNGNGAGKGGEGAQKNAPGAENKGDPVDIVTGRMFMEVQDFGFPGPMPFRFCRTYNSRRADRDIGLGFGWSHCLSWVILIKRTSLEIVDEEGLSIVHNVTARAPGTPSFDDRGSALTRRGTPDGHVYELSDAEHGLTRVFRASAGSSTAFLIEQRDRNGNALRVRRDPAGRIVAIVDSAARTIDVHHDDEGRLSSMSFAPREGPRVVLATYGYDADGNLASATDPAGYTRRYGYDEHRLVRHELKTGLTYFWRYQFIGDTYRTVETWGEYPGRTDPALATPIAPSPPGKPDRRPVKGIFHCRFDYAPEHRWTEVQDACDGRWRYEGNEKGLVTKMVDPKGGVTTRVFDKNGHIVEIAYADGATMKWVRDERGRMLAVEDPFGTTTYKRDAQGFVIQKTTPNGAEHVLEYDARGNLTHIHYPDGTHETRVYDARGLAVQVVTRAGGIFRNEFDPQGNLVRRTSPDGSVTRTDFDDFGRKIAQTNGIDETIHWRYDIRGDVIETRYHDGANERRAYDPEGNLIWHERVGGRVHEFMYGGHGWMIASVDPLGRIERYTFDPMGRPLTVTNTAGEVYSRTLDRIGNEISSTSFDGRKITAGYDTGSRCIRINRHDGPVDMEYDSFDRHTKVEYPDGDIATYAWDAMGHLIGTSTGNVARSLDLMGRITHESSDSGIVDREYGADGRLSRVRSSHGADIGFRWDSSGRLAGLIFLGTAFRFDHDALGRERQVVVEDRLVIRTTYATSGRLESRAAWLAERPDMVVAGRHHAFDSMDHVAHVRSATWGPTVFGHDRASQLERATAYDAAGQRVVADELFVYGNRGAPIELTSSGAGREYGLGGRVIRRFDAIYHYDDEGRRVEKRIPEPDGGGPARVWRYHWDGADRLIRVDAPDCRVDFTYDGLGRRLSKRVRRPESQEADETRYVWLDDVLLHEISPTGIKTFAFDPDSFGLLALRDSSGTYGAITDDLGTVHDLVATDGRVAWSARRCAYGEILEMRGNPVLQPLRFAGQIDDPEIGLYYNRHRYYDPCLGHYISPDPLGITAASNEFLYTSDPMGAMDPLGLAVGPNGAPQQPGETDGEYTSRVGPYGSAYMYPGTPKTNFSPHERAVIDVLGAQNGCHSCGKKPGDSGFKKAHKEHDFTPDHQPPRALYDGTGGFRLYPHCGTCRDRSGGSIRAQNAVGMKRPGYLT